MVVRIVKHAMEIIHLFTDANPIQIILDAVINRSFGFTDALKLVGFLGRSFCYQQYTLEVSGHLKCLCFFPI
ncbi:putative ribosomal protein S5/S7 [Helianthus anomalus]